MGLNLFSFSKKPSATVQRLPSGSLTVDPNGRIVAGTVPSTFPQAVLKEIAMDLLSLFREARAAQVPLTEFEIHFASLHITARELRGGAIIFFSPKTSLPGTPGN